MASGTYDGFSFIAEPDTNDELVVAEEVAVPEPAVVTETILTDEVVN